MEVAVVLNLREKASPGGAVGEVDSSSSTAEDDSLGGGYDQEKRRWKVVSEGRGGEPLGPPKRVEKLGFWENELRRFGGGRGTGPGEGWVSLVGLEFFRDIQGLGPERAVVQLAGRLACLLELACGSVECSECWNGNE
jgi:hypothetical protein